MSPAEPGTERGAARPPRGRVWLRLGVSLGLLGLLFGIVDRNAIGDVIGGADPAGLIAMLALLVLERLFAAYRWLVLTRPVAPGIGYVPLLRLTLASNFLGWFMLGGVGVEVLRVWGLTRRAGDLSLALSSVLLERLCGLATLALLVVLGMLVAPVPVPPALTVPVLAVMLLVLIGLGLILTGGHAQLTRLRLPDGVRRRLGALSARLDLYRRRPALLAGSLGLALLFQSLRIGSVMVGALALQITVDPLLLVLAVPVAILVGMLPVSIGGLGPREAVFVALLGLAGVAPEPALTLVLTRELLNLVSTLPGAFMAPRAMLRTGVSAV